MAALPSDLALPSGGLPAPAPSSPPRRNLRLAPAPRRTGRYLLLMVAMAAFGVFGCVALNALAAEQSFAVRELELQVSDLTRQADELTVEVTRLESPSRLHGKAVRELGMVPAVEPAFVVLPGAASEESEDSSRTMAVTAAGD